MKKITYILITLVLFSCGKRNQKNQNSTDIIELESKNELLVTKNGDSLEIGYWKYNVKATGIFKEGEYKNGIKIGNWKYKTSDKEKNIEWVHLNKQRIKFNYPKYLKISNIVEPPTIFIGDIVDGNNNTYIALLEYNLKKMKSSVYDYLYQVNKKFKTDKNKFIVGKKFKKYTYKNIEIYTVNIQTKQNGEIFNIISQVFEVDGYLYDFTYKDISKNMDNISLEIFKDMLYSIESNKVDFFNYNARKYLQEEDIVFE